MEEKTQFSTFKIEKALCSTKKKYLKTNLGRKKKNRHE